MATVVNFLSISPADRRILIAGPSSEQEVKASATDWKGLGMAGAAFGAGGVFLPVIWALHGTHGAATGGVSTNLVKKMMASSQQIPSGVMGIDHQAMADKLKLPTGHPVLDHAYAIHPLDPLRYLPIGSFHATLFEEKRSQLLALLASLGAKTVTLQHRSGHGQGKPVSKETYSPKGAPSIPSNLAWLDHEPTWRELAERRTKSGLREATLQLEYKQDYGVSESLETALTGFGVKAGDHKARFEPTIWEVHAEFA
jgi:hypothetical protein